MRLFKRKEAREIWIIMSAVCFGLAVWKIDHSLQLLSAAIMFALWAINDAIGD